MRQLAVLQVQGAGDQADQVMADKNMVVAVNSTRPKKYHTIRFEGTRSSWASFICLGVAAILLHSILDGGVDAACSYKGTEYNCCCQKPPLVAIPKPPLSTTTSW